MVTCAKYTRSAIHNDVSVNVPLVLEQHSGPDFRPLNSPCNISDPDIAILIPSKIFNFRKFKLFKVSKIYYILLHCEIIPTICENNKLKVKVSNPTYGDMKINASFNFGTISI